MITLLFLEGSSGDGNSGDCGNVVPSNLGEDGVQVEQDLLDGEKEGCEDTVKKDHQEAPPAPGVDANQAHKVQLYTETFLKQNRDQKTWTYTYSFGEL